MQHRKSPLARIISSDRRAGIARRSAEKKRISDAIIAEAEAIESANAEVARVTSEIKESHGETIAEHHTVKIRILLSRIKHAIMQADLTFGKIMTDGGEKSTNKQFILARLNALETALNGQLITSAAMLQLQKDIEAIYATKVVLMQSKDDQQRFHGYQLQSVILGINDLVAHTQQLSTIKQKEYDAFHKVDRLDDLKNILTHRNRRIDMQLSLEVAIQAIETYAQEKQANKSLGKEKAARTLLTKVTEIKKNVVKPPNLPHSTTRVILI